MVISLEIPATFAKPPTNCAVVLGSAYCYRALDAAVVTLVHNVGDLWILAPSPGLIDRLLVHAVDPHGGADIATVVTSVAEVIDSCIVHGDFNHAQVNTRSRELGIIVHEAVLHSHSPEFKAAVAARVKR